MRFLNIFGSSAMPLSLFCFLCIGMCVEFANRQ